MRIVALTGGIGAGKSTVAALLAARGAKVIDVDAIGRQVLEPGGAAEAPVLARFGDSVADDHGRIDRAALGDVVFSDPAELAALEAISHPAINRELDRRLDELVDSEPGTLVVLDMAILLGSRLGRDLPSGRAYGEVVVVEAPESIRVQRLVEQRGMAAPAARSRIAAQPTDEQRRAIADHVLVNDGDLESLEPAVDQLLADLG